MSERNELITQFSDVTGIDEERARFYLESSAWQLEVALASFYENDGDANPVPGDDSDVIVEPPTPPQDTSPVPPRTTAPRPTGPSSRLRTMAELTRATTDSSDEEEGQAFYAGGSEHSGQQVLGPGKKKDIVSMMFKSVKERGAEVVDPGQSQGGRASTFAGAGYRLGQTSNDSEVIGAPGSDRRPSHTEVVLKLWKEGFSINDGQLRQYSDPENRDFLESVRKGEIPMELLREGRGTEIQLNMEDHRHDEFKVQKQKLKAFSGAGHVLGSPAPATVGTVKQVDEKDRVANEEQAKSSVIVDPSEPVTTVQIRLADGSRLVGRFNHTHTIGDVRRFITTARPQYQSQSFSLLTTFPSKELSDNGATLSGAGILNSAVMQRLT